MTCYRASRAPHLRLVEGSAESGIAQAEQSLEPPSRPELEADLDSVAGLCAEDLAVGGPPLGSPALVAALDAVAGLPPCDLMLVPVEPDRCMLEAGAEAGGVDRFTASRIYRAMTRAAE